MNDDAWTVVKVGGSLFDLPDLRRRLHAWLASVAAGRILLVPGGGAAADAIRTLDRIHHLGAEASHWLALRAMSLNAGFLCRLFPEARLVGQAFQPDAGALGAMRQAGKPAPPDAPRLHILDALPFFTEDERASDHLPHQWDVTSDSLSVRAAVLLRAQRLILLKSVSWADSDWAAASQAGIVDPYFPEALRLAGELDVRIVNLQV
jgi:aspartokinase-like uncharacterized kinase